MNKPLQKLRRFFTRTKRLNATATPDALSTSYDDDDGASRLSGAFVVVLLLHIVALVGVFAFARIKDSRAKPNETKTPEGANASALAGAAPGAAAPGAKGTASVKQTTPAPTATPTPAPTTTAPAVLAHTVPAATSIPVNETGPAKNVHVVKTGETLTKIATSNGVTVQELVKANGLKNENDLRVGQELKIPEAGKTPAHVVVDTHPKLTDDKTGDTYVVKKGDNLTKISTSTGVKTDVLMKLNGIKDPKKLQEGQKLKLPKKA